MMEEKNKLETTETIDALAQNEQESSFDFRTIFTIFILNWQWFALSIFICLCGALIYLSAEVLHVVDVPDILKKCDKPGHDHPLNFCLSPIFQK